MPQLRTIAIDGPVAAGKTTVGRCLARRLGFRFLDTGQMYRAATLAALERSVDLLDGEALAALVKQLDIQLKGQMGEQVLVNGEDVSHRLRRREVDQSVSLLARVPDVRQVMVAKQREQAHAYPSVVVGRDIGETVLPDADLKVFLDASAKERAARRYQELREGGADLSYEAVLADLEQRDRTDMERAVSPLRKAEGAQLVNTDGISVKEVVERILELGRDGAS